jgi:hypothetical protein
MTRYYTIHGNWKHGLIADRVKEFYVLVWDHKKKIHSFVRLDFIHTASYYGTPVVFETPEHEKEFLAYHPDAACLRREVRYGYVYPATPEGIDEKDIKIERRRGRWCWKKA